MRQVIARIDDELHERLKVKAAAEGRSLNSLIVEALAAAVRAPRDDRAALRARMATAGLLVVPHRPARAASREAVIAATRGTKSAVSEALAAERLTR